MMRQLGGALGVSIVVAIIQAASGAPGIDPFADGWRFAGGIALVSLAVSLAMGRVGSQPAGPEPAVAGAGVAVAINGSADETTAPVRGRAAG